MNIKDFRGSFNGYEPERNSLFRVSVRPPASLLLLDPFYSDDSRKMEFRCKGATTPGRNIQTTEFTDYGPMRKIPLGGMYEPVNLEFICATDNIEQYFFESWQKLMIDSTKSHDLFYYNDIISNVTITKVNTSNKKTMQYILLEAYPISVQQIQLNWDDTNTYTRMIVQMQYREYDVRYFESKGKTDVISEGLSTFTGNDFNTDAIGIRL